MLMTTPADIEHVLYDGALEYSDAPSERGFRAPISRDELLQWERSRVTVGEPRCWPITDFFSIGTLPQPITSQLKQADFFVVRLACNFRAGRESHLEWAQFSVELTPDGSDLPPPLAFDLHPQEVSEERKTNYKIELSPGLKFKERAEVSLGKAGVEFEYKELVPAITAYGAEQSIFGWSLEKTPLHPLEGIRWFHVVMEKPKSVGRVHARFEVLADVVTPRGLWRAALRNQETMQLERDIC
jgi:hypothetical protein